MDPVAAWKGHEDEVPPVRVEADQDGPDDDAGRSETPAHGCGQAIGVEDAAYRGCTLAAGVIRSSVGGSTVPKVVVTHAVVDVARWLEGKAERAAAIESGSGSNVVDHVAQDGSNSVAITADVTDLAAMGAMLSNPSPEVVATMESHGVVQPLVVYVEA